MSVKLNSSVYILKKSIVYALLVLNCFPICFYYALFTRCDLYHTILFLRDVKKLFMPDYSPCDAIFWNRNQFCHNNHFCQGASEKDTRPILSYVKNRYNSHYIDKIVRDVKKIFLFRTIAFVMLCRGIGVSFPEIIGK